MPSVSAFITSLLLALLSKLAAYAERVLPIRVLLAAIALVLGSSRNLRADHRGLPPPPPPAPALPPAAGDPELAATSASFSSDDETEQKEKDIIGIDASTPPASDDDVDKAKLRPADTLPSSPAPSLSDLPPPVHPPKHDYNPLTPPASPPSTALRLALPNAESSPTMSSSTARTSTGQPRARLHRRSSSQVSSEIFIQPPTPEREGGAVERSASSDGWTGSQRTTNGGPLRPPSTRSPASTPSSSTASTISPPRRKGAPLASPSIAQRRCKAGAHSPPLPSISSKPTSPPRSDENAPERSPPPDAPLSFPSQSSSRLTVNGRRPGIQRASASAGGADANGLRLDLEGIIRTPSPASARPTPMVRKKSGELVKSSLKQYTPGAGPNSLPSPTSPYVRGSKSCPTTPTCPKYVHFDTQLEHVRLFRGEQKPAAVSRDGSPTYETVSESETEYPFPVIKPEELGRLELKLPNFPPAPLNPRNERDVFLESVVLADDGKSLRGIVQVKNLAFTKHVAARFTLDLWQTVSEVSCTYCESVKSGLYDRFAFTIKLQDLLVRIEDKTMYLAVRYNVEGREIWDNNGGANYQIELRRGAPAATTTSKLAAASSPAARSSWSVKGAKAEDRMADLKRELARLGAAQSEDAHGLPTFKSAPTDVPGSPSSRLKTRYDFGASLKEAKAGASSSPTPGTVPLPSGVPFPSTASPDMRSADLLSPRSLPKPLDAAAPAPAETPRRHIPPSFYSGPSGSPRDSPSFADSRGQNRFNSFPFNRSAHSPYADFDQTRHRSNPPTPGDESPPSATSSSTATPSGSPLVMLNPLPASPLAASSATIETKPPAATTAPNGSRPPIGSTEYHSLIQQWCFFGGSSASHVTPSSLPVPAFGGQRRVHSSDDITSLAHPEHAPHSRFHPRHHIFSSLSIGSGGGGSDPETEIARVRRTPSPAIAT